MNRNPALIAIALVVASTAVYAGDALLLTVTRSDDPADFFQLESSGRKNIAASDTEVGLVWEKNRKGQTASYLAFRQLTGNSAFGAPVRLGDKDAFDPVIAHCGSRYYVAWIENAGAQAAIYTAGALRATLPVVSGPVNELSIACAGDSALLAWSKHQGKGYAVEATRIEVEHGQLSHVPNVAVAPTDKYRFQTNPGVAFTKGRIVVTWHDRSSGTNLLYATSGKRLDKLDTQVQINELIQKSYEWGSGSSAVRNALAVGKDERLVAVWLDKRASRAGYKVYSAFSNDGGISWSDNYNIIDEWGTILPQWTPAVASNGRDKLLAVWMDSREDEKTIWMSRLRGMTWGSNIPLSGDAEEAHSPVVAYSPNGILHAAWIETGSDGSRIRYYSE
jgi:hypothetical protein